MDTSNKTPVYLDEGEAKEFLEFRQHKAEILAEEQAWKELKKYCKNIQYGSFSLAIKDGKPHKITKPLQTMVFGLIN